MDLDMPILTTHVEHKRLISIGGHGVELLAKKVGTNGARSVGKDKVGR